MHRDTSHVYPFSHTPSAALSRRASPIDPWPRATLGSALNYFSVVSVFASRREGPAFFLMLTHVGGVISFGAGAISFTHIIKATEPVMSAALSAAFFRE